MSAPDDIVTRLLAVAWLAEEGSEVTDLAATAAAEIERLRAQQDSHPRRAEVTQRYVDMLEAIDALHQPNWHDNSGRDPMWCDTCCVDWPCSTHLLIHKEP